MIVTAVGMASLAGLTAGQPTGSEKSQALKAAREAYEELRQEPATPRSAPRPAAATPATKDDQRRLNALEYELINRARELCAETEELRALSDKLDDAQADLAGDPQAAAEAQAMRQRLANDPILDELEETERALGFSVCEKRLYDDFRSYDSWGFTFSGGAEWVSVSEIFQDSLPLVDLLVYRDFRTPQRWRGLPQFYIDAQLSNSAEALAALAPAGDAGNGDPDGGETEGGVDGGETEGGMGDGDDGDGADGGGTAGMEVEPALNFNLGFFVPLWRFGGNEVGGGLPVDGRRLRDYLGFLVEGGFRELDSQKQVDYRFYGGLRLAFNPEWYVDVLYGKTDSLESDRLELRGQFPVAPLGANSRVYLGIVANIGVDKPRGVEEDDVVRVYATWNLDVKSFFLGLGNGG